MNYRIPTTLETPRLTLRTFQESDWPSLCEMFREPECVRYTLGNPLQDWQTWRTLATYLGHWQIRGYGPYAAVEKISGKMMGPIGLWYPGEWPETEIKWSIARPFWDKGYVTEAAQAVQEMAFRHLKWKRLISLIVPENARSQAVAKRIGGRLEKTIPFRDTQGGVWAYDLEAVVSSRT